MYGLNNLNARFALVSAQSALPNYRPDLLCLSLIQSAAGIASNPFAYPGEAPRPNLLSPGTVQYEEFICRENLWVKRSRQPNCFSTVAKFLDAEVFVWMQTRIARQEVKNFVLFRPSAAERNVELYVFCPITRQVTERTPVSLGDKAFAVPWRAASAVLASLGIYERARYGVLDMRSSSRGAEHSLMRSAVHLSSRTEGSGESSGRPANK